MKLHLFLVAWLGCAATAVAVTGPQHIVGRVVDEHGQPVADADVDCSWSANGSRRDKDGKPLEKPKTEEGWKEYWGHLGEMVPSRDHFTDDTSPVDTTRDKRRTGLDGRFSLSLVGSVFTLMAMDHGRTRGGTVTIPHDYKGTELKIQLGPLVRVHGSFASPNPQRQLGWTYAKLCVPDDPMRPLGFTRLSGCGSYEGEFAFLLPAGRYDLYANNDDLDWELHLSPGRKLVLTADRLDIDLGAVPLRETQSVRFKERQAKKEGTLGDYTKMYGQAPPRWHAIAARGVNKDVDLSAFKGKWVLLDFWGLSCGYCLSTTTPELIKFYEEHAADRARFEILSICIDDEIDSLAEFDRRLKPIIQHLWNGKSIPFPVLLDNTFETWRRFGIPGLGFVLLVDPEGHVVKGDLKTLAEKLKG